MFGIHLPRRRFLSQMSAAAFGLAGISGLADDVQAAISTKELRSGDVLFGRLDAEDSPKWGYWRHVAIWDGSRVIEGGMGQSYSNVSATDLRQFERRYRIIMVLRLRWSSDIYGPRMAKEAYARLGRRAYCSLLVQEAYNAALGQRVTWMTPDHIAAAPQFRSVLSQHR